MNTPENIKDRVAKTLNSVDAIETVKASPFFKDRTMQRIFGTNEEKQPWFASWFTPKWQLATLVLIIGLNIFVLAKSNTSSYHDDVDYFGQTFNLKTDSEDNLFN